VGTLAQGQELSGAHESEIQGVKEQYDPFAAVRLQVDLAIDEIIRLVKALQFTDLHGEVCPAGWQPGKPTMNPDPKGSQKYFNTNA